MILDNTQNNQIEPEILNALIESDHIDIATAFFTNKDFLEKVIDVENKNCSVRLIVRLNDATDPNKLKGFIGDERIDMRYFKDNKFHPKCYIIKDKGFSKVAYIGSANLTRSGMLTNQEIMVLIKDDDDLSHLNVLFQSYWEESEVITEDVLQQAIESYNGHNETNDNTGNSGGWGDGLPFGNNDKLQQYQREYQDYGTKFNHIKTMYENKKKRKFPALPIRIEIDGFLSSVYAKHNFANNQDDGIPQLNFDDDFEMWIALQSNYVSIFVERYQYIIDGFSEGNMDSHSMESLQQLLFKMHAPRSALQRYPGGFEEFIADNNGLKNVISKLSYLLGYGNGSDSQILRMHNLISNNQYQLTRFRGSSVQEVVGWCNNEELPIINARSKRILDYYSQYA